MGSYRNVVRTAAILSPYKCEKRNGANGSFESKSICFSVAVDRDYSSTVVENGQTVRKPMTDWFMMRATGAAADTLNNYCTAMNNGKLVSRRLLVDGNVERYDRTWTNPKGKIMAFDVTLPDGKTYTIPEREGPVEETYKETVLVVTSVKFLDGNPTNKGNGTTTIPSGTTIMAQPVATPSTNTVTIGTATPQPAPAPVDFSQQVQQAAANVAAEQNTPEQQPQVEGLPMGMSTAPSVGANFTATSDTAPF